MSRPVVDRDYWVAHSDGFRIYGSEGRIGFVEETRLDPDRPGGVLLLIRAGVLGRRVVAVRADDVALIVPRTQQIWLHSDASLAPADTERPARLAAVRA